MNTTFNVSKTWLSAFNAHDLESLLKLYHDEAIHFSPKLKIRHPETNGLIKGKAALRAWWQDAFGRLPQLEYREMSITANDDRVFMEYTRLVPGEETINVAEVLDIKEGLIVASRVYHG